MKTHDVEKKIYDYLSKTHDQMLDHAYNDHNTLNEDDKRVMKENMIQYEDYFTKLTIAKMSGLKVTYGHYIMLKKIYDKYINHYKSLNLKRGDEAHKAKIDELRKLSINDLSERMRQ